MNIQILDSWLRDYLETNATPYELASSLSLCGPSFERVDKVKVNGKTDYLYDIEVTTNRVDMMSVYGIAREAYVILPEFGYRAKLKELIKKRKPVSGPLSINLKTDPKLTTRVMGIVLQIEEVTNSPKWITERLHASGIRSLNLPVDITNYVMLEVGHPTHVFDYDLVKPDMIVRSAKAGESIVSLENKEYVLEQGDVVIDNGKGDIIDLPGIIGTRNSVVNENTKRILYFMETIDPVRIRKTSIRLGIRTNAAILNEKGVDPFLSAIAMERGIELFEKLAGAKVESKIYDLFPTKPIVKPITLSHQFIEKILGTKIDSVQILRILKSLDFKVRKSGNNYVAVPPTFRSKDVEIPEDIVEEIARIYGYHKLPSVLMNGIIPKSIYDSPFGFENELRNLLRGMGGNEIYTNSLVPKSFVGVGALKIANPLGSDTSALRSSLRNSLVEAANTNKNVDKFHLFEIANVYTGSHGLPEERMTVAGILKGFEYRDAKGWIETMLSKLRIYPKFEQKDSESFKSGHRIECNFGEFGVLENGYIYFSFDVNKLHASQAVLKYTPIPKFPPQIEDITITTKEGSHISDIIDSLVKIDTRIDHVDYIGNFKGNHTLRVYYQDPEKTLDNKDVEMIRNKLITKIISMGLSVKE